ncbi:MAG: hypothetical protein BWY28_01973 [bacterium ADurb.Bin236]|nr:MAG: hypothetical protein BWY28_01973 [bacterium ADurb.Bin236]HOY61788.1 hypothetical protein [bacterium]HPN93653.1 hypothetical protein [bacterium]
MENLNEERSTPETFEIKDVEIFRAGTWTDSAGRTVAYTEDDLKEMAEAHRALEGRLDPPVKLGHDPEQRLLSADGLPAAGWLRNVRAQGGRLLADLVGVPAKVYDLIRAGAYRKRSLEVLHGYRDEATGATHKHVATGLALLGAALPAIGSLADIGALYGTSGGGAAYLYESGPAGILDDGGSDVASEPTDADNPEDEMTANDMIEKIAALKARIAELEELLIIAEKQDAELDEGPEAESREETASEDGTGLDNADAEELEVAGDVADASKEVSPGQEEASGATEPEPNAAEDGGGDEAQEGLAADGAQAAYETESEPSEDIANEDEIAVPEEENSQEAGAASEEMSAALDEALEKLREARERLDEQRMREAAARERARRQFVSRNAGRIPPAFRGLVIDLLAILDGDASAASDYARAAGDESGLAAGFRGFVSALSEHPAMSEYGREGVSGGGEAGGAGDDSEELIKSYCAARGLDYDDASDYSRAALAALEYVRPPSSDFDGDNGRLRESNNYSGSYPCDNMQTQYNKTQKDNRLAEYGLFGSVKKHLSRRIIQNESGEALCVVGNKKGSERMVQMYLASGGNSIDYLFDADGIVIIAGQRFAINNHKEVYSSGVIKTAGFPLRVNVTNDRSGIIRVWGPAISWHSRAAALSWGWPM